MLQDYAEKLPRGLTSVRWLMNVLWLLRRPMTSYRSGSRRLDSPVRTRSTRKLYVVCVRITVTVPEIFPYGFHVAVARVQGDGSVPKTKWTGVIRRHPSFAT